MKRHLCSRLSSISGLMAPTIRARPCNSSSHNGLVGLRVLVWTSLGSSSAGLIKAHLLECTLQTRAS